MRLQSIIDSCSARKLCAQSSYVNIDGTECDRSSVPHLTHEPVGERPTGMLQRKFMSLNSSDVSQVPVASDAVANWLGEGQVPELQCARLSVLRRRV